MPIHASAADHIQDLGAYVSASPSSFHAAHEAGRRLAEAGVYAYETGLVVPSNPDY